MISGVTLINNNSNAFLKGVTASLSAEEATDLPDAKNSVSVALVLITFQSTFI